MPTVTALLNGYSLATDQGSPAFCSIVLVESEGRRLVFDFGHVGRRRALRRELAERGFEPADIDTVVLSHGHWDHIQNIDLFAGSRVVVHPAELTFLANPAGPHTPSWTSSVLAGLEITETAEGDEVLPGVQVIELPGHTPGSIGLSVATDDGTVVLTGDAVPTLDVLRSGQASGQPTGPEQANASIARVAALADFVLPGHDQLLRRTAGGAFETAQPRTPLVFRGASSVR
ncbi:MBL fold metallo-hydrolase [Kribbella sp. NPDC051770]|uniref:MBL fold metallo-hydrolase n=1 Tax=Kribbella sp. NPDC051770 TaxID=3155413 RepID=UPI003438EFEC